MQIWGQSPFSLGIMIGQTKGSSHLTMCVCRRDRNGYCYWNAEMKAGLPDSCSTRGWGRQRGWSCCLKPDLCTEWETMIVPQFLPEPQAVLGEGKTQGHAPPGHRARQKRGSREPQSPWLTGSTSVPLSPRPTLYHQPSFAHGVACAVLGDAEVVSSILWAGVENPQLSAG